MNIKTRLAKLEVSILTKQESRFTFTTMADFDDSEIIGFRNQQAEILRQINENFDDFKSRASIFYTGINPQATVFFVRSIYEKLIKNKE